MKNNDNYENDDNFENKMFVTRELLDPVSDAVASLIPKICVVGEVKHFHQIVDAILDAPEFANSLAGYPKLQKEFITGNSATVENMSRLVGDRVMINVRKMVDDEGWVTYRPIIC